MSTMSLFFWHFLAVLAYQNTDAENNILFLIFECPSTFWKLSADTLIKVQLVVLQ